MSVVFDSRHCYTVIYSIVNSTCVTRLLMWIETHFEEEIVSMKNASPIYLGTPLEEKNLLPQAAHSFF